LFNVITFSLPLSDHIKRIPLYFNNSFFAFFQAEISDDEMDETTPALASPESLTEKNGISDQTKLQSVSGF